MERTGPQVHVAPVRCPFCHEGIPRGEAPAVCAECHALHHAACMSEHGACAACGRKTSSPEDSKLAAALRARASARLEQSEKPTEERPTTVEPDPAYMFVGALFGASFAAGAVAFLDPPSNIPIVMAGIIGAFLGSALARALLIRR
jgi:hypothetical protein